MDMNAMREAFEAGKLDKRVYWPLMREKFSMLDECRRLLSSGTADEVAITKDGVVLETEGIKLLFDFSQVFCRAEVILSGTERESLDMVSTVAGFCLPNSGKAISSRQSGVILDIGANVGRVSLALHRDHPDCIIYALEPVKETFMWLLRNLELNKVSQDDIVPLNMGLYSSAGDMKFFVPQENEAASMKPVEDSFYAGESGAGEETCAVTTLDDFVLQHGINMVHFIKIDTEGAEKMVLCGGKSVLSDMKPAIYTEMLRKHSARFGYHPNEIIDMMAKLGYGCYTEDSDHLVPFSKMDENTIETNFFFLHKEQHAAIISRYA